MNTKICTRTKKINSQELINRIKKGDPDTIAHMYHRNFTPVHTYILVNGGTTHEAEDVFQEALIALYKKARSGKLTLRTATLHTYFYAMCKNLWISHLTYKKRYIPADEPLQIAYEKQQHYDDSDSYEDQYRLYQKHKEQLALKEQQLLQLVEKGKSTKEIAVIMGCTEGCARKRKFDIKKALIQTIQQDWRYRELSY